ncbi:MAG: hypothetical protein RLZZ450_4236 [Pseudomonadota bacterium]|jgi:hypothetical protein
MNRLATVFFGVLLTGAGLWGCQNEIPCLTQGAVKDSDGVCNCPEGTRFQQGSDEKSVCVSTSSSTADDAGRHGDASRFPAGPDASHADDAAPGGDASFFDPKVGGDTPDSAVPVDGHPTDCAPQVCESTSACLVASSTGNAKACDEKCVLTPLTKCKPGDGCCPMGCTSASDNDCSKSCGDGTIEEPETCEPSSGDRPCPVSCGDTDPCTSDYMTGSAEQCNVTCTHVAIVAPADNDKCCPPKANMLNDNDCQARYDQKVWIGVI